VIQPGKSNVWEQSSKSQRVGKIPLTSGGKEKEIICKSLLPQGVKEKEIICNQPRGNEVNVVHTEFTSWQQSRRRSDVTGKRQRNSLSKSEVWSFSKWADTRKCKISTY